MGWFKVFALDVLRRIGLNNGVDSPELIVDYVSGVGH